jgi:hypothetical protein
MRKSLLRNSVDVLKHIRAELQGSVEDSVVRELDDVIHNLDKAAQTDSAEVAIKALDVLFLLGQLVEKLPEIAKAIEYLTLLIKATH